MKIELEILESDYETIKRAYKKYTIENKNSTHLMSLESFILINTLDSIHDFMSE